jgi:hypothetical protein
MRAWPRKSAVLRGRDKTRDLFGRGRCSRDVREQEEPVLRSLAVLAVVIAASLLGVAAGFAAGPSYVAMGGPGVVSHDGTTRYVALPIGDATAIERIRTSDGTVLGWNDLGGAWGIPAPTSRPANNEGLTRDGKRLIVATAGAGQPTSFAVLGARTLQVFDRFDLEGSFAYDALSPDGSTLYLIQHVDPTNDISRYVVRAYDLRSHRLLPGRIADKTQAGWVMDGFAVTRATSADGRWVYTLYTRPGGGYPFVHALDALNGVAHCVGLPWHGGQSALMNMRLALGDNGRTLAVNRGNGQTWLTVNTTNWAITHPTPSAAGFPWRWLAVGIAGVFAVLALAGFTVRRRRHPSEAAPAPL